MVKYQREGLGLVLKHCGDPHKTVSEEIHYSGLVSLNAEDQEGRTSAHIFMVHSNFKYFQTYSSHNTALGLKDTSL